MKGANLEFERNPIDSGVESYEDFQRKNKTFIPSWNLRHLLSPYSHEKAKNESVEIEKKTSSEELITDFKRFIHRTFPRIRNIGVILKHKKINNDIVSYLLIRHSHDIEKIYPQFSETIKKYAEKYRSIIKFYNINDEFIEF